MPTTNIRQLDHLNMSVDDFEQTAAWYRDLFGFEVVERGQIEGRPWGVIRAGDAMLCIYERPGLEQLDYMEHYAQGRHTIAHFGLRLTDLDDFLARAREMGVRFLYGGDVGFPNSRSWYVHDPTGHTIEVVQWDNDEIAFDPMAVAADA